MAKAHVLVGDTLAAELSKDEDGYHFQYLQSYLDNPAEGLVSLSFPLQAEPFHSKVLFPFFDGLIPEGWLLNITTKNWKLDPTDRFSILLKACSDCIGNVSIREVTNE